MYRKWILYIMYNIFLEWIILFKLWLWIRYLIDELFILVSSGEFLILFSLMLMELMLFILLIMLEFKI